MEIKNVINSVIKEFVEESRQDYLRWKRKNVTLRGLREANQTENGGMAMLGQGLYTAYLGNREMARQYGKVYFVLNAIPKKPIVFNTLNDWEIWSYNKLIYNWCIEHGFEPSSRTFYEHTNLRDEIMKLGYDGVAIKGREIVNYTPPDNVVYFEHEYQLENYYENAVGSINEDVSNGEIYYHGSNNKFDAFDLVDNKTFKEIDLPVWFFTKDINYAKKFGKYIYKVKLNISKTFDTSNKNHFDLFVNYVINNEGKSEKELDEILDEQFYNELPYWTCEDAYYAAITYGFDSILIAEELEGNVESIGVFDKNKITII